MARDMGPLTAETAGLAYASDGDAGIERVAGKRGMAYRDARGRPVTDAATLSRIAALAIPPAWTDVWICPDPSGHIQAVGRDARGRKQYRYHPAWRAARDETKYSRLMQFGSALPRLRRAIRSDLRRHGLPREKVLAAVVSLLEATLIRVGNDEYAKQNKSFGLTTLRKRHVTLSSVGASFEFRGKSGVEHRCRIHDPRLARVLRGCQDLPGQRLLQYLDADGVRRPVESADVNAYIRDAIGEDFSAKDFRTWAGTLAAAHALSQSPPPASEAEARRSIAAGVKSVAKILGNTPAVCRACYVHPVVIEAFTAGELPRGFGGERRRSELALLTLLRRHAT